MGRLAGVAVALALSLGCGEAVEQPSGRLDQFYKPTGLAVQRLGAGAADARLLVASSNSDLQYATDSGGSIIALEGDLATSTYRRSGAVNVRSFAGDLALADPAVCGTIPGAGAGEVMAFFATRGSSTLNKIRVTADGGLGCAECGISLTGPFTDPLSVVVGCGPSRGSVFVGYLQTLHAEGWFSEYVLADGAIRHMDVGAGPVRGLAYDAARDRVYVLGLATGSVTPLKYVDLAGCTLGLPAAAGGCVALSAESPATLGTIELRSMALAPPVAGRPQRAFLTGRVYDPSSAALGGARTTDLGGKLLVVDLLEGPSGLVLDVVDEVEIGRGAQDVRLLPRLGSWPATRGDLVAALSVDDAYLWLYDSDTGALAQFGRDPVTGTPFLGGQPFGLAVDPVPIGNAARVYVGSFTDSYVIPIDVPLDAADPVNASTYAGGSRRFITGAVP